MRIFIASALMRLDRELLRSLAATKLYLQKEYGKDSVYLARSEPLEPEKAFAESKRQIRQADVVIVFTPNGPATAGVLVELGLALAWDKPVLALVKEEDALPYFLRRETATLTILLMGGSRGMPLVWGPLETYFRFIKAYIENKAFAPPDDGLSVKDGREQLEARLPALETLRELEATTTELLNKG